MLINNNNHKIKWAQKTQNSRPEEPLPTPPRFGQSQGPWAAILWATPTTLPPSTSLFRLIASLTLRDLRYLPYCVLTYCVRPGVYLKKFTEYCCHIKLMTCASLFTLTNLECTNIIHLKYFQTKFHSGTINYYGYTKLSRKRILCFLIQPHTRRN